MTLTGTLREALRVLCEKPRCARLRSRSWGEPPFCALLTALRASTPVAPCTEAALRASTWGKPPLERAGSPMTNDDLN